MSVNPKFVFRPLLFSLAIALAASVLLAQEPVTIHIDARSPQGPLRPVWKYFGYDEPNYTYAKHGQELVGELGALSPTPVYIRTHNLLTSGDGTPSLLPHLWRRAHLWKPRSPNSAPPRSFSLLDCSRASGI